jgi:hypothetical protein
VCTAVFEGEARLGALVQRVRSWARSSCGGPGRETAPEQIAMAAGRDYTASDSACTRLGVVSREGVARAREAQRIHVTVQPGTRPASTV